MESVRIFRIEKHVELLNLKGAATGQSVISVKRESVSTTVTYAKSVREGSV